MNKINVTKMRNSIYKIIDSVNETHVPVLISGKRKGAVLIGEEDWRSVEETLFLLAIPKMRESIKKGLKTPLKLCSTKPGW